MSTKKGIPPRRPPIPKPATIAARAAEIRAKWTEAEAERRRAEAITPVCYWPIDGESIGLAGEWAETAI